MSWNDLQDIRQLEGLVRAHVILAQMVGNSSPEYIGHILKAFYSLNRLIYQAIENAITAMKEISKLNALNEANTAMDKKEKCYW
jgi:hypothetical protein